MKRAWLALALGAFLAGCGETRQDGGSNTNWLSACETDSDCPDGGECWCRTCSAPCTTDSTCSGTSCTETRDLGCGEQSQSANLCVAACETSEDCAAAGDALSCVRGACLAASEPAPENAPRPLALAERFGCLVAGERVFCWGNNDWGQLGFAPVASALDARVEIAGVEGARSVAVSESHACALTASGDVSCWGSNDRGQLGESSAAAVPCSPGSSLLCRPEPARVEIASRAVEIATIDGRTCARLETGAVTCWGAVDDALSGWAESVASATSLALGNAGACATLSDGSLTCSFELPESAIELRGLRRVELAAQMGGGLSWGFGCALGERDSVVCFGDDSAGELGSGGDGEGAALDEGARAVALGRAHACAVDRDSAVRCWGRNSGGALGSAPYTVPNCGTVPCARTSVAVEGLPRVEAVGAAGERTCALATDGTLWCWGIDSAGWGPTREPGPWEAGGDSCGDALRAVTSARYAAFVEFDSTCEVAEDCIEWPLDFSCDHTCATALLSASATEATSRTLGTIEQGCAAALEAGCAAPAVECASSNTRLFCRNGYCDRYDAVRSECDDPCACELARFPNPGYRDECEGFDLEILYPSTCSTCDDLGLSVTLINRGTEPFSGQLTLRFTSDEEGPLPAPLTESLILPPGDVSPPIRYRTDGVGGGKRAILHVTAPGDCNPANDAHQARPLPKAGPSCP